MKISVAQSKQYLKNLTPEDRLVLTSYFRSKGWEMQKLPDIMICYTNLLDDSCSLIQDLNSHHLRSNVITELHFDLQLDIPKGLKIILDKIYASSTLDAMSKNAKGDKTGGGAVVSRPSAEATLKAQQGIILQ
jgi:hypothetical protein